MTDSKHTPDGWQDVLTTLIKSGSADGREDVRKWLLANIAQFKAAPDMHEWDAPLTFRQSQILNGLTDEFASAGVVARRAGIHTISPSETAAKFCIQLVKLGLAEKGGERQYPMWRKKAKATP